jgi:uncharacterized SAM-binding protein YcdF (DUF218 family)
MKDDVVESGATAVALCVLGCRSGSAALARRATAAREAFFGRSARSTQRAPLILACGGLSWAGEVEADAIARILVEGGVPDESIVRERASRDTFENAIHAATILRERGIEGVVLVTCSWHLPRARGLFERVGLRVVDGVGVPPPNPTIGARLWWAARERVASAKDVVRRGLRP